MELPRDSSGLLILRETGELVSSEDLLQVGSGDLLGLDDSGLVLASPPSSTLDLSSDLSLDEEISLMPLPPPLRPAAAPSAPPRLPSAAPALPPAARSASAPLAKPASSPRRPPPVPIDLEDEPEAPLIAAVVGTPLAPPPAHHASRPVMGRTVGEAGLKPMSPRVVGVGASPEPAPVSIAPRRMASVGPRAIKERDRRTGDLEAPSVAAAARPKAPAPSLAQTTKAQACFEQAMADFRAGNTVAAQNGLKLAMTYCPGDTRFQQALARLRAGQPLDG